MYVGWTLTRLGECRTGTWHLWARTKAGRETLSRKVGANLAYHNPSLCKPITNIEHYKKLTIFVQSLFIIASCKMFMIFSQYLLGHALRQVITSTLVVGCWSLAVSPQTLAIDFHCIVSVSNYVHNLVWHSYHYSDSKHCSVELIVVCRIVLTIRLNARNILQNNASSHNIV